MTNRALLITSLFTAGCIGAFAGIVRYADALESSRPYQLQWVRTYTFDSSPTKLNCETDMDRITREIAAVPDEFTNALTCLPVKERE